MSLTDELKQAAQKLVNDPRILKVLQSEQTLRLLTLLVEMPDRFGALSVSQGARFARNFHLATREDVERLERRVADLEAQLAQYQNRAGQ
jgi:polyhydroxyalkanoate synthesis regulator phasin